MEERKKRREGGKEQKEGKRERKKENKERRTYLCIRSDTTVYTEVVSYFSCDYSSKW
jgi:hypothetical protein